jgi:outer membrane protein assembly factor BamB
MRRLPRAALAVLAAAVLGALLGGCNYYAPGWSAVHADSRNSDYSPVAGASDVELAWHQSFAGAINLGPTHAPSGDVYVTSTETGCHLAALDPETGARRWCSPEVDRFAVISSPVVDQEGRLFLADGEAMHAFDADGQLLWETPIEGVPLSAQITPNGRVFFITHIGNIHVLRRDNGRAVLPTVELIPGATWDPSQGVLACARGTEACPSANTPAIDTDTGRFIFTWWEPGEPQAGVRAMQIVEKPVPAIVPLWTNDSLPGGSGSSPTVSVDGTRVYVNDNVDSIHAIDADTGTTIWSFPIGYASGGSPSLTPEGRIMPAGGAGPVLAVQDEGDHGSLVWRRDDLTNRGIPTQTAGDKSYAAVTASGFVNDLVVLDAATGAELDREPLPGTTIFTVGTTIGADGTVYVPSLNGQLFAFRPA